MAQPAVVPSPHPAPIKVATPAPPTSGDIVTLSQAEQVVQLSGQGESASLISQDLGVSVSIIDLDLGIVAQTASIPLAAPSAHAAVAAALPAASATPVSISTIA